MTAKFCVFAKKDIVDEENETFLIRVGFLVWPIYWMLFCLDRVRESR